MSHEIKYIQSSPSCPYIDSHVITCSYSQSCRLCLLKIHVINIHSHQLSCTDIHVYFMITSVITVLWTISSRRLPTRYRTAAVVYKALTWRNRRYLWWSTIPNVIRQRALQRRTRITMIPQTTLLNRYVIINCAS